MVVRACANGAIWLWITRTLKASSPYRERIHSRLHDCKNPSVSLASTLVMCRALDGNPNKPLKGWQARGQVQ